MKTLNNKLLLLRKKPFNTIIVFLIFPHPFLFAEYNLKKNVLINNLDYCLEVKLNNQCKNLISKIETIQIKEYELGNFKCQTSLLGVQTELIKIVYFDLKDNRANLITPPYLIKNC